MSSSEASSITFTLLKEITDDFSEEKMIGRGGFGEVYKAVLNNGDEIAVKKLFPIYDLDDTKFDNEFSNLMSVQHKNIVRLLRYCYETKRGHTFQKGKCYFSEETERALCFEYMQGGSLSQHISKNSCKYDWPTTYKIIEGTCEGLHYLHKGRGEQHYIYHLDLKPDNILLDENLVPKIGDFGLSRLFGESKTYEISKKKGTAGFMPPEYIDYGKVTPKNDVFSLGVVIFYMLAGKKGYGHYRDALLRQNYSDKFIIDGVQESWKKKMEAVMGYRWDETDILGVRKCTEIAISCVHNNRDNRPSTTMIIEKLKKLDARIKEMLKEDPKPPMPLGKLTDLENNVKRKNCHNEDLGKYIVVDPSVELCFPFEPKRDIPCCLQLINKSGSFVAFNINTDPNKCRAQPNRGILAPLSNCYIILTLQAQEKVPPKMTCHDKAIVQATRVSKGFTSDKITQDFLKKSSAVDVAELPIVYVTSPQGPSN
ncbi:cysteine-rich receptor-like protein kinase 44 isoform X1 [Aegilops tauschii subsp. strangulata]|uniref:Protein kinase domain-containing protein n=4 Tax=Aegilops tauschii subsp. strangulata TaxID=200361 RepID=A0A453A446_AEGTS|nr:putative receptor-like protein kinase At4g00960 isoform X1 [Aegilops tauschii subsp. strangulata]